MDPPLQALIGSCDEVAVSAQSVSAAAMLAQKAEFEVLLDSSNGAPGPLRGILSGAEWADARGADLLLTAPCDAVSLQVDQLNRLVEMARDTKRVAVGQSARGIEPLIAAWPVSPALEVLRQQLINGAHPAVTHVIALLGYTAVGGFDGANVNTVADLHRLGAQLHRNDTAGHARLFSFENDFVRTLRCIPMCVRFKLDRSGIKLTLRQWSRFTFSDREALRMLPCETEIEVKIYRSELQSLVEARSAERPAELQIAPEPAWASPEVPTEILAFASERGFSAPSQINWSRFSRLERYALVKLSRDKHENANFEPALREFGVEVTQAKNAASE